MNQSWINKHKSTNLVTHFRNIILKIKWKKNIVLRNQITLNWLNFELPPWKSRPVIMKIMAGHKIFLTFSNCHHENLDLSLWKSRPFIIKSQPVIMKISNYYHENLDLLSWKSWPFIIKSRPVIMKILVIHNKILTCHHKNLGHSK